jgi:simple sugar transport system ATP-binding protein
MSMETGSLLVQAHGIVKRYGNVLANDRVDFELRGGEVHALLGENGAGKSTLSRILYGFTQPDAGEILVDAKPAELRSPRDARALGIGMVFQNFTLIPALDVLENIALFLTDLPPVVSRRDVARRIRILAGRFGLSVDPLAPVRQISVGDQQKVEILKLLLADARVLILDEPTKVLAPHEVEELFGVFRKLKAEGYAILFITHKMREVLASADRITVMRQGRIAGTRLRGEADEAALVSLMFGDDIDPAHVRAAVHWTDAPGSTAGARAAARAGATLLELRGVHTRATGSQTVLRAVDLSVREGEIVGVAGVSGNGQKELGDLILGLRSPSRGTKLLRGRDASGWSIGRVRASGVAFVPEDPLAMAAVGGMSVRENFLLGTGRRYARGAMVDWKRLASDMAVSYRTLGFTVPGLDGQIRALSGGNLQRAVVAREMAADPRLIIALYPTRGLDVRSAVAVRRLLRDVTESGTGILLISEDLEELQEMSDRLLVMYGGSIAGEFGRGQWNAQVVGHLMTGSGTDAGKAGT